MSSHFTLSFELVLLMNWLLKNGKKEVAALVRFAIKNGFISLLEKANEAEHLKNLEDLPNTVLDFIMLLEDSLIDALEEIELESSAKEKLVPTIKKLDLQKIDIKTLWLSMQQTKSSLFLNAKGGSPQKIFYEKILKNWTPAKNEPLN